MLVVDGSCTVQVVTERSGAEQLRRRLGLDEEQAAPHAIDVGVLGVVRRDLLQGRLDPTAAEQAVEDLRSWPGERYGHRSLLERAWEPRASIGGWDSMYVALAEALDATLLTLDGRLAAAPGPRCRIEVPSDEGASGAERVAAACLLLALPGSSGNPERHSHHVGTPSPRH